jgi:hypothetical protein
MSAMTVCSWLAGILVSSSSLPTFCKACSTVSEPSLMPSKICLVKSEPNAACIASVVALVCSQMRKPNSFTTSAPLSEKMPCVLA